MCMCILQRHSAMLTSTNNWQLLALGTLIFLYFQLRVNEHDDDDTYITIPTTLINAENKEKHLKHITGMHMWYKCSCLLRTYNNLAHTKDHLWNNILQTK